MKKRSKDNSAAKVGKTAGKKTAQMNVVFYYTNQWTDQFNALGKDEMGAYWLGNSAATGGGFKPQTRATVIEALRWWIEGEKYSEGSGGSITELVMFVICELSRHTNPVEPKATGNSLYDTWNTISWLLFGLAGKAYALELITEDVRLENIDQKRWSGISMLACDIAQMQPQLRTVCDAMESPARDDYQSAKKAA